jgi:hypothetical protein
MPKPCKIETIERRKELALTRKNLLRNLEYRATDAAFAGAAHPDEMEYIRERYKYYRVLTRIEFGIIRLTKGLAKALWKKYAKLQEWDDEIFPPKYDGRGK